jgi:transcriptional regulator with XRE-family HTH domain
VAPRSPTVASWELALRLRQRREQLGIEVRAITEALNFTRNYWSAVENDRKILTHEKLSALMDLYELPEDEKRELLELREVAKQRGWWTRYSALFGEHVFRYYGLEHGAQAIRTYESVVMPGLLQSEDYARALMSADVTVRPVEVDERVHFRARRQERLRGDDPLQLTVVLSQAALLQQIGGPRVLQAQLVHLAKLIDELHETIEVRIVPFTATGCGLFGASTLHLIDFASPRLPAVAYQETVTAMGIIEDSNALRDLTRTYTEALGDSLSAEDSLVMINEHIRS